MHYHDKMAQKQSRLDHIEEIFNNTMGWTRQLYNLYEERKALRLELSRYKGETNDRNQHRDKRSTSQSNSRNNLGNAKVRKDVVSSDTAGKEAVRNARSRRRPVAP